MAGKGDSTAGLSNVLWGFLALAAGLGGTALDVWLMHDARVLVATWSETEGQILASRVRKEYRIRESSTEWPDIDYEYWVNGERFAGHCCSETDGDWRGVRAFVDENQPGTRVAVYVNPTLVTESRLKASIGRYSGGSPWVLLITLTFVAVGVFILLPPRARDRLRRMIRRGNQNLEGV